MEEKTPGETELPAREETPKATDGREDPAASETEPAAPRALDPVEVLKQVGLGERMNNFPAQLSGGEQQRVSIARALCKNPALLLCDEPTGALDSKTGLQVLALLKDVSEKYQTTVAIVTHNAAIAPLARRVIRVRNRQIESVELNDHPASVEEIAW